MSTSVPLLIGPVVPSGIAKITGPILLGELFNWCLYGVLIVQVSLYSYYFPFDKWAIKVLVYSVFVAETVQTILTGIDICYWFAAGFGNIERLSTTYIAPLDTPMFGALIAFVVQSSFCYRIWALQKSLLWWCLIIEVVSLYDFRIKQSLLTHGTCDPLGVSRSMYRRYWRRSRGTVILAAAADCLVENHSRASYLETSPKRTTPLCSYMCVVFDWLFNVPTPCTMPGLACGLSHRRYFHRHHHVLPACPRPQAQYQSVNEAGHETFNVYDR
ncbi:hypothetical protein BC834DRAFT_477963 [Gloeopeniophorella convolvens]|nr:hypothetical protein BC834DRAFT_477963 [Gloeopeniophorella convolvens]